MTFWWKQDDKKDKGKSAEGDNLGKQPEGPESNEQPVVPPNIPGAPRILTPEDLAEEMRRMIEQIMPQMAPLIDQMAKDIQRALETGHGKGEIRIVIGPPGQTNLSPQTQPPKQPEIPVEVIPTEEGALVVAQVGEMDQDRVSVEVRGSTIIIGDGTIGKAVPLPISGDSRRSRAVLRNGILEITVVKGENPGEIRVER